MGPLFGLSALLVVIFAATLGPFRAQSFLGAQASSLAGRSGALLTQARFQPPSPPPPKLIKAGRVLDVRSGSYLSDQGILTQGERIKEIGPWSEVISHSPADAVVIDLSQATLLPGLIDCHAHLLIPGDLGRVSPGELISLTLTQSSGSMRVLLGARNAREVLDAGITSARIVGHSGIDGDVALRDGINAGWIP